MTVHQISVWCHECAELHDAELVTDDSGVKHYDTKCGIMVFLDDPNSTENLTQEEKGIK